MSNCPNCEKINALELERLAPLKRPVKAPVEFTEPMVNTPPAKPACKCKKSVELTEAERSIYFHAGRYAAGARDASATAAFKTLIVRGEA